MHIPSNFAISVGFSAGKVVRCNMCTELYVLDPDLDNSRNSYVEMRCGH